MTWRRWLLVAACGGLVGVVSCGGATEEMAGEALPVCEAYLPLAEPDGPFVKPEGAARSPWMSLGLGEVDEVGRGFGMSLQGHAHMRPDRAQRQFWLYDGETVVFDVRMEQGHEARLAFDAMVFVNFEPVPFAVVPADPERERPFVSTAEAMMATDFDTAHLLEVPTGEVRGWTIVVPAEVFEARGGYDVRFVAMGRPKPRDDRDRVYAPAASRAMTVYYNGYRRTFEPEALLVTRTRATGHVADGLVNTGVYVEPSWAYYGDGLRHSLREARYGQLLEVADERAVMTGWIGAYPAEASGRYYAVVLDGVAPIAGAAGIVDLSGGLARAAGGGEYEIGAARFEVDVPVDDEVPVHTVRLLRFAEPNCGAFVGGEGAQVSNAYFIGASAE